MGCLRGGFDVWVLLWLQSTSAISAELPTEYSCLWFYQCTSLHRLVIMVHAVNNSVISKFSWLGEGLAVAGVFHGIHLTLFSWLCSFFPWWNHRYGVSMQKSPCGAAALPDSSCLPAMVSMPFLHRDTQARISSGEAAGDQGVQAETLNWHASMALHHPSKITPMARSSHHKGLAGCLLMFISTGGSPGNQPEGWSKGCCLGQVMQNWCNGSSTEKQHVQI